MSTSIRERRVRRNTDISRDDNDPHGQSSFDLFPSFIIERHTKCRPAFAFYHETGNLLEKTVKVEQSNVLLGSFMKRLRRVPLLAAAVDKWHRHHWGCVLSRQRSCLSSLWRLCGRSVCIEWERVRASCGSWILLHPGFPHRLIVMRTLYAAGTQHDRCTMKHPPKL